MLLFDHMAHAKPFLKWAGGKGQLLSAIKASLPEGLHKKNHLTYIEPFIGSGAVLFWFLGQYPQVTKAIINDINPDLTNAYSIIKNSPEQLISVLSALEKEYYSLKDEEDRKAYFLNKRELFNQRNQDTLTSTGLLIFLNRTCFNGLYRVNSQNKFNVPFGKYEKPKICDEKTILANSKLLQKVIIMNGDFSQTLNYAAENTFFYLDPPYKPISKTSSFNSYALQGFGDASQERLAEFCRKLDSLNHLWLLSNSDPKNIAEDNHYFEQLYKEFYISRVKAKRNINANGAKRGEINELLIANYQVKEKEI